MEWGGWWWTPRGKVRGWAGAARGHGRARARGGRAAALHPRDASTSPWFPGQTHPWPWAPWGGRAGAVGGLTVWGGRGLCWRPVRLGRSLALRPAGADAAARRREAPSRHPTQRLAHTCTNFWLGGQGILLLPVFGAGPLGVEAPRCRRGRGEAPANRPSNTGLTSCAASSLVGLGLCWPSLPFAATPGQRRRLHRTPARRQPASPTQHRAHRNCAARTPRSPLHPPPRPHL